MYIVTPKTCLAQPYVRTGSRTRLESVESKGALRAMSVRASLMLEDWTAEDHSHRDLAASVDEV